MRTSAFALLLGVASASSAAESAPKPVVEIYMTDKPSAEAAEKQPFVRLAEQAKFSGTFGIAQGRDTHVWHFPGSLTGKAVVDRASSPWRWASVTKQVVAVLVLQEVAKGTIALDQPIGRYLPRFASPNANKITVRQLLRHQTGLPNPDDTAGGKPGMAPYYLPGYGASRDPLRGYCAGPVKGEPGGNWTYNNCDYIVAGALLEAVTGQRWPKLVEQRIVKPLGLKTLRVVPGSKQTRTGLTGGRAEPMIDLAAFAAAGALQGSIDDLLTFDRALMTGKLLPPAQQTELWDGRPDLGYIALGQWVFEAPLKDCAKPVKLVERRGAIGGVQVRNFIAPDQGVAVAAFTDKAEGDFDFGEIWQGSGFSHDLLNLALCKSGAIAR